MDRTITIKTHYTPNEEAFHKLYLINLINPSGERFETLHEANNNISPLLRGIVDDLSIGKIDALAQMIENKI